MEMFPEGKAPIKSTNQRNLRAVLAPQLLFFCEIIISIP
jgi:hypothetical protein